MDSELEWLPKPASKSYQDEEQREEKNLLSLLVASKPFDRIRRSADFSRLKSEGSRLRINDWLLLSFDRNNLEILRFGVTVPGKVGNAVLRNRLKRWVKSFITNSKEFHRLGVDINFVFLPASSRYPDLTSAEVFQELAKGFVKVENFFSNRSSYNKSSSMKRTSKS